MDLKELQSMLTIGETVAVEFKRCGNGMESDTYETVKSVNGISETVKTREEQKNADKMPIKCRLVPIKYKRKIYRHSKKRFLII